MEIQKTKGEGAMQIAQKILKGGMKQTTLRQRKDGVKFEHANQKTIIMAVRRILDGINRFYGIRHDKDEADITLINELALMILSDHSYLTIDEVPSLSSISVLSKLDLPESLYGSFVGARLFGEVLNGYKLYSRTQMNKRVGEIEPKAYNPLQLAPAKQERESETMSVEEMFSKVKKDLKKQKERNTTGIEHLKAMQQKRRNEWKNL